MMKQFISPKSCIGAGKSYIGGVTLIVLNLNENEDAVFGDEVLDVVVVDG
jgi:hypothetical protein